MGVGETALKFLVTEGVVAAITQRHPVNRSPALVAPCDATERFQRSYLSLFQAAKSAGLHHLQLKARLKEAGVDPIFRFSDTWVSIYE
jgi:hypothetical protein